MKSGGTRPLFPLLSTPMRREEADTQRYRRSLNQRMALSDIRLGQIGDRPAPFDLSFRMQMLAPRRSFYSKQNLSALVKCFKPWPCSGCETEPGAFYHFIVISIGSRLPDLLTSKANVWNTINNYVFQRGFKINEAAPLKRYLRRRVLFITSQSINFIPAENAVSLR